MITYFFSPLLAVVEIKSAVFEEVPAIATAELFMSFMLCERYVKYLFKSIWPFIILIYIFTFLFSSLFYFCTFHTPIYSYQMIFCDKISKIKIYRYSFTDQTWHKLVLYLAVIRPSVISHALYPVVLQAGEIPSVQDTYIIHSHPVGRSEGEPGENPEIQEHASFT